MRLQTPRIGDASTVCRGLANWLDREAWSFFDWSQVEVLGHYLSATAEQAMNALRRWPGWEPESDTGAVIGGLVDQVLRSEPARNIVRAKLLRTEPVTRLDAVQQLASEIDTEAITGNAPEPFPSWAIAAIVLEVVSELPVGPEPIDHTPSRNM